MEGNRMKWDDLAGFFRIHEPVRWIFFSRGMGILAGLVVGNCEL